jgi:Protein of unknown function (DUF1449)
LTKSAPVTNICSTHFALLGDRVTEFWFADQNLPFAGAGFLLMGLMLIQMLGAADLVPDMDSDMDGEVDGFGTADGLLSFLGLGRLPLMIWLALLLLCFMIIGYAGQQIISGMTGGMLPAGLAALGAGAAAIPLTAILARPIGRIMPKDETTAVSIDSLVGRFATIDNGTATPGNPARAKVKDVFGHIHNVMVEPDNDGQRFAPGEKLLLVRREGDVFKAISQGGQQLPRLEG